MKILSEVGLSRLEDSEVLKMYETTCIGIESVEGLHPFSFAYSDVQSDLKEEILKRMKKEESQ